MWCIYGHNDRSTFFLGLSIIRHAMSRDIDLPRNSIQILGACSIMLANLMQSDFSLSTDDWVYYSYNAFTAAEFTRQTRTLFVQSHHLLGRQTSYSLLVDATYHRYEPDDKYDSDTPLAFTQGPLLALWMLECWGLSWFFTPIDLVTLAIQCTNHKLSKLVLDTIIKSVPNLILVPNVRLFVVPHINIANDFVLAPGIQYIIDHCVA
jgi:hypothetical protein